MLSKIRGSTKEKIDGPSISYGNFLTVLLVGDEVCKARDKVLLQKLLLLDGCVIFEGTWNNSQIPRRTREQLD